MSVRRKVSGNGSIPTERSKPATRKYLPPIKSAVTNATTKSEVSQTKNLCFRSTHDRVTAPRFGRQWLVAPRRRRGVRLLFFSGSRKPALRAGAASVRQARNVLPGLGEDQLVERRGVVHRWAYRGEGDVQALRDREQQVGVIAQAGRVGVLRA